MIYFTDGLLLSVSHLNCQSSTLLKCHNQKYIMEVSQSKVLPENFLEGGSNFIEGGSLANLSKFTKTSH